MTTSGPLATALRDALAARADPAAAVAMQAYMKSAMPFRGVAKPAGSSRERGGTSPTRSPPGSSGHWSARTGSPR